MSARLPWTLIAIALLAGCPLDPDAELDYERRADPTELVENVGCWLDPLDGSERLYSATCTPVLHPTDPDKGTWENFGILDFDVEPIPVMGSIVYRVFYAAGGQRFEESIGMAQSVDAVTMKRIPSNPLLIPPDDEEVAALACTAIDRVNNTHHAWYRREDGQLYHATSLDGLAWVKEDGAPVSGLTADGGLQTVLGCCARFEGSRVQMTVGGVFADGSYAIGESGSDDGVTFDPVTAPVFAAPDGVDWLSAGIGYPSVLRWGSKEFLLFIGATEWDETLPAFPEPKGTRIGVARRNGDGYELVRSLPLTFEEASPTRVRAARSSEWVMVYMRDRYHGPVVFDDPFDSLGLMMVRLEELEVSP